MDAVEHRLFVGRERELATFDAWLADASALSTILGVSGRGGIGKSALLRAFGRRAPLHGRAVVAVDARDLAPRADGLLRALGSGTADNVLAQLNATQPLILLDNCEELGAHGRALWQEIIPRLDVGAKLVLAGRYTLAPPASDDSPYHRLVRSLPLDSLPPEHSREYLQRRDVRDERLIAQIVDAAGGNPLALVLAADMVVQEGMHDFAAVPDRHLLVRALVERLLRDVREPLLRELLEACAVVRHVDEATLAALVERTAVAPAFHRLAQLSLVRASAHGLVLHDDFRQAIAADLRWRRPERYQELRARALAYYRARMATAAPAERERWLLERLFLWEYVPIRSILFGDGQSLPLGAEPGGRADVAAALERYPEFLRAVLEQDEGTLDFFAPGPRPPGLAPLREFVAAVLDHPATRWQVVRHPDGQIAGWSTVMPVCGATMPILARHPPALNLLHAYFGPAQLPTLPEAEEDARVYYVVHVLHGAAQGEAVRAALARDLVGQFAGGGVYLAATPLALFHRFFTALGFERLSAARNTFWGAAIPTEGFVLDLDARGVEAWLDAVTCEDPPAPATPSEALAQQLQAAWRHWYDDAWLARSALVQPGMVPGCASDDLPALRAVVQAAVELAQQADSPRAAPAYSALTLVYLRRTHTPAQAARTLAVSRRTFYRLVHEASLGVARALCQ